MTTFGMWGGCCSRLFGGYGSSAWFGPILNMVIVAGVFIGLIWLLVWIVRRLSSSPNQFSSPANQPDSRQTPLDIMKIRYARGEITRKEYQMMLKDLD